MSQHSEPRHAAPVRLRDRLRRLLRSADRPWQEDLGELYRPVVPQLRDYPVARRR